MRCWKNIWGLVAHPYAFFEEAISRGNPFPATIFFVTTYLIICGGWWKVNGKFFEINGSPPIFGLLLPLLSYPAAILVIFIVCRLFVREIQMRSFFATWGFSFLPTFLFFLLEILVHGLVKIPWFSHILGFPLSIMVLWALLLLVFLWKLLFLAIVLRLAGNLNLGQMVPIMIILAIIVGLYWAGVFSLGWMKVPFI